MPNYIERNCYNFSMIAFLLSRYFIYNLLIAVVGVGIGTILRLSGLSFEVTSMLVGVPIFILFWVVDDFFQEEDLKNEKLIISNKFTEKNAREHIKEVGRPLRDILGYANEHQRAFALGGNTVSFQLPLGEYFKDQMQLSDDIALLWAESVLKVDLLETGSVRLILIDHPEGWGLAISVFCATPVILNTDHYVEIVHGHVNEIDVLQQTCGIFPLKL